eukprot:COSAG02_NODE_1403_length_12811_cov_8.982536_16_plen_117_part_00
MGHRDSQGHGWVSGPTTIPDFGRVGRWAVTVAGRVIVPTRQKNATQGPRGARARDVRARDAAARRRRVDSALSPAAGARARGGAGDRPATPHRCPSLGLQPYTYGSFSQTEEGGGH